MTGSMYAAIAGLQTHMQKMSVIGNNIANANTAGFKPGVTTFTESMYTSISASTAGGNTLGGVNAAQIGYGSQIGTIDMTMSAGTPAPTNQNSDLYLNGNGFFLVGPKPTNAANPSLGYQPDPDQLMLKRVGDFGIDKDGYLVDSNGNCVYGFMPLATTANGGTIDPNQDINYDTCLRPIRLPVANADGNAFYPTTDTGTNLLTYDAAITDTENRVKVNSLNLSIDNNGVITAVTDNDETITVGAIAIGNVRNPNGLTKEAEGYYRAGGNSGDVTVGAASGILDGKNLNNNAVAGTATIPGDDAQAITSGGGTTILAGYLESSKTDISTEFADLITTQRGFQANTKIITVTDEMLSELVNMKR